MPRSLAQRPIVSLVKGLITEASELTFPDNASIDESNCDLERKGNRRRRLGVAYETSHELSTFTFTGKMGTGTWVNVGGNSALEYLVIKIGAELRFYNKAASPISSGVVNTSLVSGVVYALDMTAHEVAGGAGAAASDFQFTSLNGALIVASPSTDTLYIERDNSDGTFTETVIPFRVRDFEWQGDVEAYTDNLATASVSDERKYDTANVGWSEEKGSAALSTFKAAKSAYPALSLPWYSGKTAAGAFSVTEWEQIFAGSSLAANGHYILDLYSKDRNTASGLTGIPIEIESSRFSTVASFAGRVWYSGMDSSKNGSKVFFSQLVENLPDVGKLHQVADPTSEDQSDLVATDGGHILLPDTHGIKKLYTYQDSVLVFADNGVWQIRGVDGVFKATEYAVNKITSKGVVNPESFVDVEGVPLWWSREGIHTMASDQVSQQAVEQNLSQTTIQSFWEALDKENIASVYDRADRKVFWFTQAVGETNKGKYTEVLVLDLVLQAFYPWTISDYGTPSPYVAGVTYFSGEGADVVSQVVTNNGGEDVVDQLGDDVTVTALTSVAASTGITLIVSDPVANNITMAQFTDKGFKDWGGGDYSSFVDAGYNFMGDLQTKKTQPYLTVYCGLTEEGWSGNETDGYTAIRPSSLLASAYWDFKDVASTKPQQAYRQKRTPFVNTGDLTDYDYEDSVITTRLKLRGRGRSVRLRFESESGKDFNLIGYEELAARNTTF